MNIGKAMQSMMRSEEMLNTALVMRCEVRALHCEDRVGTAQYSENGRHHAEKYRISMTTKPSAI